MNILPLAIDFSAVWSTVWPVLMAILFFGIIIAIHELGHFVSAKLFGIKVNEFALGMGPAIFKKQKGETKYAVYVLTKKQNISSQYLNNLPI